MTKQFKEDIEQLYKYIVKAYDTITSFKSQFEFKWILIKEIDLLREHIQAIYMNELGEEKNNDK